MRPRDCRDAAPVLEFAPSRVHDLPMQPTADEDRPLPAAAAAAMSTGHMIDAIKLVREAEGLSLTEAKQRVEAHVQGNPMLKAQFAEQQTRMKRRLIQWVATIDLLLVAAVLWYFFGR
jgi:ribosomal protein L7/L12